MRPDENVKSMTWLQLETMAPPQCLLQPIERPGLKPGLTIKLELFTPAFRADLTQFEAALSAADIGALYDDLDLPPENCPYRPKQPLKPSTVKLRVVQIKYAASALVHSGLALSEINGLADLLTPTERVKTVIRHLRERGAGKRSSYVEGVVEALRHAARYCQADPQTHRDLATLKKAVQLRYDGMVSKNRDRLRAITEPGTKAIILSLPQLLLDDALKLNEPLDATDVKNGVAIERQLPPESAAYLEQWLSRHRPLLAKAGSPWLFPGTGDKPLQIAAFRTLITRGIRDYANVEIHPHLFRHFCAWMHLQHYPGDFEGVRRLLGHKRIETSFKSYIAFEQDIAAQRYDKVALKEREAAKRLTRQLAKPARSNTRKPAQTKEAPHAKAH
jgi:hypothetical protein